LKKNLHFRYQSTLLGLLYACFISATANAVTTINVPPSPSPAVVDTDTVVDVLTGGVLQANNGVIAQNGGTVNINGGLTGDLTIRSGTLADVVSGGVNGRFWAENSGRVLHEGGRSSSVFLFTGGIGEIRAAR
jgi:hypothetical protein